MAYAPAPGKDIWRTTFANVIANNIDTNYWTLLQTGSGQTVNQTGGNLLVTTGTTTNSETVIRSNTSFQTYTYLMSYGLTLSQRIANQNFFIEMVDVIGDGLAYSITNATTVVVTIPSNPFTSLHVGQSMYLGVITGAAGVPMRATIASVSGNNVTYTVAGWPASGTGTLSVFGYSYQQVLYDSTTATSTKYDGQRKGWNSGFTTATINTTAAPGHVAQIFQEETTSLFGDSTAASSTTFQFTQRASRLQNIPNADAPLYFQIRVLNGTSAPASTTTLTVNFATVEKLSISPIVIENASQVGAGAAMPVQVMGGNALATQPVSGSVTVSGSLTSAGTTTSTPATPTASTVVTAATNNLTNTKNAAGTLYSIALSNTTATPMFFKLYNKASAPVVASDVPVMTIPMAANSHTVYEYGSLGLRFGTGISWACTGAIGDTDATNTIVGGKIFLSYI